MASSPVTIDSTGLVIPLARPVPPRFWWLKRVGLTGGLLGLCLAGVHFAWDAWSRRVWERQISGWRATGERVLVEDFVGDPPAEDENGARLILELASRSAMLDRLNGPGIGDFTTLSGVRAFQDIAHRAIDDRATELCLLRAVRYRTKTDWGIAIKSPVMDVLFPHLSQARDAAKLACAAAMVEHDRLNDAEAIEFLLDGLEIGARLRRGAYSCFITDLVAGACDGLVADAIESISSELNLETGSESNDLRRRMVDLIERLVDEAETREGNRLAILGERVSVLDTFQWLGSGRSWVWRIWDDWRGVAIQPAWRLDSLRVATRYSVMAEARREPTWPQASAKLPNEPELTLHPAVLQATFFSQILCPQMTRAILLQYSVIAARRMAATGLAVRLFEIDHDRLPDDLNELVPEYLGEIPLDPMAADGRRIGYVKSDRLPRLYSVGLDGIDQAGRIEYRDGIPGDSREEPLFFLTDRPRSAHAVLYESYNIFEAYKNDSQIEGNEGNDHEQNEGEQNNSDGPE